MDPILPDFDIKEWEKKPWPDPPNGMSGLGDAGLRHAVPVYLFYVLKVALYIWVWTWFCSFTPGIGSLGSISVISFSLRASV